MVRKLAPLFAVSLAAFALAGCPEDEGPVKKHGSAKKEEGKKKETPKAEGSGEAKPDKPAAKAGGGEGKFGTAKITGVVDFTGAAPEMKTPAKRKDAEFCKDKDVKYNAVVVNGGKLQDVLVRIAPGGVKGDWKGPKAVIDQKDCMYEPRIQGVVAGSEIEIKNSDGTLHNVHTFKGTETWFNQAQPKGSEAVKKEMPEDNKVVKFTCDVHPWMRGFVVVTDHPFFAVSKADGTFTIDKVPAGEYDVEAWHTQFGLKKAKVKVEDGKAAEVKFSFDGKEEEPAENKDELKGLF